MLLARDVGARCLHRELDGAQARVGTASRVVRLGQRLQDQLERPLGILLRELDLFGLGEEGVEHRLTGLGPVPQFVALGEGQPAPVPLDRRRA